MICFLMFSPDAQWNLAPKETKKLMPWLKSIFLFSLVPSCATDYNGVMCNCQSLNRFHERIFNFFSYCCRLCNQTERTRYKYFYIIFCYGRCSRLSTHHNLQDCWNRKTVFSLKKYLFQVSCIGHVGTQAGKRAWCNLYTTPSGWVSQEDTVMYHGMHLPCAVEIDIDIVFKT